MVVLEELMAALPTSMAPELVVVTAGTVRLATVAAELAMLAGAASGFVLSTPE